MIYDVLLYVHSTSRSSIFIAVALLSIFRDVQGETSINSWPVSNAYNTKHFISICESLNFI